MATGSEAQSLPGGEALASAVTPLEAAEAVVAHLDACGLSLPSVYLEQAGRLRCWAQRGYWQVLDGIPCDVGIMGRSMRLGRTIEISDAAREEDFLFAAPDLRCEITVPVQYAGKFVGAVNIESRQPFPAGARSQVEAAAAAFERRLAQIGGPPAESTAQRVARLATAMTTLRAAPEIRRAAVEGALQLSGMSTAALVEPEGGSRATVSIATGPLSGALENLAPEDLHELDRWVAAGSSLYANGSQPTGLDVHGRLRHAGVTALAVVPLTAGGEHLGSLIVASATPQSLRPVVLPSLEILGAQAASSISTARTLAKLELRARQDPLTELGHHATFQEELRARLAASTDRELALMMVDVDDFKAVNDRYGHTEGDRVLRELSAALAAVLRSGDQLYRIGGDEFATILEVDTIEEAQHIAARMADAARVGSTTVSIGIALAGPGEEPDALVDRADAAMYRAKSAGRDTIGLAPAAPRRDHAGRRPPAESSPLRSSTASAVSS